MLSYKHRYNVSKLLQIYAIRELSNLLPISEHRVILNLVAPGLCSTEIDHNMSTVSRFGVSVLRSVLARSAEQGSWTLVHAAQSEEDSHGKFLSDCEIKE